MIKVFIVDGHDIVREALKEIIAETPDIETAGEAGNGQLLLDQAHKGDWDVVLLDIAMPASDGLNILEELKRDRPELPVLMLSMYPEVQYVLRALGIGASGYLTKESAPEELIAAIRKVSQGGKYIGASLVEKIA
jgi:DNA-binding NarL/FixJ family response regulator